MCDLNESRLLSRSTVTLNLSVPRWMEILQGKPTASGLATAASTVEGELVKTSQIYSEKSSLGRGICMRSRL